jgi:hypothetical protein
MPTQNQGNRHSCGAHASIIRVGRTLQGLATVVHGAMEATVESDQRQQTRVESTTAIPRNLAGVQLRTRFQNFRYNTACFDLWTICCLDCSIFRLSSFPGQSDSNLNCKTHLQQASGASLGALGNGWLEHAVRMSASSPCSHVALSHWMSRQCSHSSYFDCD